MTNETAINTDVITVRGARQRNLQNVDVTIPLGQFTVVTGVSGSGKSALVFETLFGEGQARLWDALLLGRHRSELVPRPLVTAIEGLPPVIGVGQAAGQSARGGTLASLADVADLLEGLFSATGTLHCPTCRVPVQSQSRTAIVESVLALADRTKVMVLAPLVRAERGAHTELFPKIARDGYVRARVDGNLIDVATPPALAASQPHTIEVVIDRLVVKDGLRPRLEESLETALELGRGTCLLCIETADGWRDTLWSTQLACPNCQRSFPPIERRTFRPNSPVGGCPACHGAGFSEPRPSGSEPSARQRTRSLTVAALNRKDAMTVPCPDCGGQRLGEMGRAITLCDWSWPRFMASTVDGALPIVLGWQERQQHSQPPFDDPERRLIAGHILPALRQRLQCLYDIGLSYLNLDRRAKTLSMGEVQRTRLAAAIGGDVTSTAFLLDEPTTGLHHRDTQVLIGMLRRLVDHGNTVIAVEHDLNVVQAADWVIDLGPGAGPHGGRVLAAGVPAALPRHAESVTGRALSEAAAVAKREWSPTEWLTFGPFTRHNLREVTLKVPLRALVGVSGVSGSGKSTLILQGLVPSLRARIAKQPLPVPITGGEELQALIELSPRGAGTSPWAVTATLCGVWTEIRRLLARTKEARLRGFTPERFSFRDPEGQCRACQGRGVVQTTTVAHTGWTLPCPECRGRRFDRSTLQVTWHGHSAADLLSLSVDRAATLFAAIPRIGTVLQRLQTLGLGYLTLGQPAATLSGGERQRLRIGRDLAQSPLGPALYVLDEPTSGLHAIEIPRLVTALRALVDAGHTVIVIEHNLGLLQQCDWHIELGPGAGPNGGKIVRSEVGFSFE
jgi:excinuclease ABC subunit A